MNQEFYYIKGRVALYAILKSLDIKSGDLVLVPGYTCIVVPRAISYLNAKPVYVDVAPGSYNSHLQQYEEAYQRLVDAGRETFCRAVLMQHTYGIPNSNAEAISNWARERELYVIEDCAHISIDDPAAGHFGHASFYSTQWSKPFTTGLGGVARVNDSDLGIRMQAEYVTTPQLSPIKSAMLAFQFVAYTILFQPQFYWLIVRAYRFFSKQGLVRGSSSETELQGHMPTDYCLRMGIFQRALMRIQRKRHRKLMSVKRTNLAIIHDAFRRSPLNTQIQGIYPDSLLRFPVLIRHRDECLAEAKQKRIELGDWFTHPLYPETANREGLGWRDGECPNAEAVARQIINIPLHSRIDRKKLLEIIKHLRRYA